MKIALDPYMLRRVPLTELPGLVADLGYEYIELSPREDFLPFFLHPRADRARIAAFRRRWPRPACEVSSVLPLYRWSGPDEDERQAAVRYWKRAIQITVDLGVNVMNSEFNGRPGGGRRPARRSSGARWRSCCRSSSARACGCVLEPHPDDFIEDGRAAVDLVRGIDRPTGCRSCTARRTPSTRAATSTGIMRYAGAAADPRAHRRLVRPPRLVRPALHREPARLARPRPPAPRHRPGRGGLGRVLRAPWPRLGFDGIATVCVFAWEERARESSAFNLEQIRQYLAKYPGPAG